MKKLLICLSLILVLVLTFVACKDDAQNAGDTTTTDGATQAGTEAVCDHEYGDWAADASVECTDEGRLYRVCTKCGEKETKADACSFSAWQKVEGKVCSDAGRQTRTCSKCGKTEKQTDGNCAFGEFVDVTAATCETAGLKKATCSKCGDTQELEVAALGHQVAEGHDWLIKAPATCTEDGIKFGTCVNCKVTGDFAIPALGHDPIADATCTDDSICGRCDEVVAEASGHSYKDVAAKDPTCTEDGYVAGTVCEVCGDTNGTDYEVLPALDHQFTWVTTVEPTFAKEGVASTTCGRCGTTDSIVLPMKKPELLYTAADMLAEEDAKVNFNKVNVTASEDGSYVTLTSTGLGAYLEFLADGEFADVISIKYRAATTLADFGGNRDGYFNLNGIDFFASVAGDNVVDYNNKATAGEWTILNIDLRKTQVDINGVEYDMLNGAAIEAVKYVLFAGYEEGASIDVSYVAFFNNKTEALEYASVNGEYTIPHIYVETEKSHTTTLNNTNGTGEYGAPGVFLNTNETKGVTVINWNGRFYNNFNLKVEGAITIAGGVQKLVYSFDGGMTWLDFAEGAITTTVDGNKVSYTAMFDLNKYEGKTLDLRIAAIVAHDEVANKTEYASVLNIKKLAVKKADVNTLDVNLLAAAGNQQNNITAEVKGDYVHYSLSGSVDPTITIFKSEDGVALKQYMLIKYRASGTGYGANYDFYFDINSVGNSNVGGKAYNANWFNLNLNGQWNYIIVDLAHGAEGKTFDLSKVTLLNWALFDVGSKGVNEGQGNWLDIAEVKFFDSYDAAKAVANPNGDKFITPNENGSTYVAYPAVQTKWDVKETTFSYTGISADNILQDAPRIPAFNCLTGAPAGVNLITDVTLLTTDYQLNLQVRPYSTTGAVPAANIGIKVGDYAVQWGASDSGNGLYDLAWLLPADFVNGKEYSVQLVIKSVTNSEVVVLNTFTLVRQPEGLTLDKANGCFANDGTANIKLSASAGALEDVVALWKGDTLVMYYGAYAGVAGFTANGGANITVVDQNLAKLTTTGDYTVKLHKGSVNGEVVATKEVKILDPGVVGNSIWTAAEIYTAWSNFGKAQWGFDAQLITEGDSQYVRLTPNASNGDGGRIFLLFNGSQWNSGWDINGSVGGFFGIKYRNHTNANQLNVCYDGCLAAGGNACGRGWIGTAANGWAMTVNEGAWKVPAGYTTVVLRFAPGMTIDIEYCGFFSSWQGVDSAYNSIYGAYWN